MSKYRYPGIHSFTEADTALFFGRERETKELYRLLMLNPVVVLFGKSGTGKTSLLQAGVTPLLHPRLLQPVKIRLNDTSKPVFRQVWEQFNDGDFLPLDTPDDLSLAEYCRLFDCVAGGEAMSPVLLLDQFEELFTLYGDLPEQREAFIAQLAELVQGVATTGREGDTPGVRIVISIRSDFLYLLDRISTRIPAILRCRYELAPLEEANARKAIVAPAGLPGDFLSQPFTYSPDALDTVLDGLTAQSDTGDSAREVEAFLLQQFCQRIERRLIDENTAAGFEVTPGFFGGQKGIEDMRDALYAEVLAKFDPAARLRVQRLVEEKLISAERRIIQERETIKRDPGVSDPDLVLLCRDRLLREEPRGGSYYYEISHDTLLAPILRARKVRLEAGEKERNRKKVRRLAGIVVLLVLVLAGALGLAAWALKQRDKAEAALSEVVRLSLLDASEYVTHLEYDLGLEKLKSTILLDVRQKEISDALLEHVYLYAETGAFDRARGILDTASRLSGRRLEDFGNLQSHADFRRAIAACTPRLLDTFDARYYPVMLPIPAGSFQMGNAKGDSLAYDDEMPQHRVTLSAFQIARTETTLWQYYLYCQESGRSMPQEPNWEINGHNPVVNVSSYDAVHYANWLSERLGKSKVYTISIPNKMIDPLLIDQSEWVVQWNSDAKGYRLPTEAEWEYAAHAGGNFLYSGSNDLDSVGWYYQNSKGRTHPVAQKKANAFGLYDMSGNVYEWCWDWSSAYKAGTQTNPAGPDGGSSRVARGGGWFIDAQNCRAASRLLAAPDSRSFYLGFRLALAPQ